MNINVMPVVKTLKPLSWGKPLLNALPVTARIWPDSCLPAGLFQNHPGLPVKQPPGRQELQAAAVVHPQAVPPAGWDRIS